MNTNKSSRRTLRVVLAVLSALSLFGPLAMETQAECIQVAPTHWDCWEGQRYTHYDTSGGITKIWTWWGDTFLGYQEIREKK